MAGRGEARVVVANRAQLSWDLVNPDGWLAPDHRARLVVGFVETLDLTVLYDKIEAREGTAGRPAADPAVLFALWLLATMDGVGSARELDRLTSQDLAYRWVACGVPVNYHGLADFRVAHADVLDGLLTKTLAAFMAEGLFDADEIVVDDDGPGIGEDALERIFERFYTDRPGESFGQNSGLGLNISRQIVVAHGGRLWAENRLHEGDGARVRSVGAAERKSGGARFVIRLPAA